ncbi:gastrula zinc finger protein XlCGF49.1-like [Triplophysa rosa]|uniref:Oocyte zinc finger protein XlCOF15-like n=1 Tax=Triplophysa rosa TaxID=992332 RepID=A0A9W7WNC7_TRIRA|nr:gastrula zinc finger protein XlCGF49.1-like [Triplophysa rosa]KAI7805340.1 putative oocyte zinc finger protein XlCOF15-like [Triplophysa rosa]
MKSVTRKKELDYGPDKSSRLTLQESSVGVPGSESSEEGPCPAKKSVEILLLSPVEEAVKGFCCRLKYEKKSNHLSDKTPSNPDAKLFISQPSSSSKTKKFRCKLCGIEYCRRANLVSHMRIHTGESPYCCKFCGKAFRRSDHLKLHVKIHTGENRLRPKPFVCEQCGMKFGCSKSLQNHMWKHSGERPYACSVCEKRFFNEGILLRHENDCHSLEKAFVCSLCGHGFARLYTLEKHTRIHTGEKPFTCSQCGKVFRYKYSLFMHNKLHSGKE